MCLFSEIREYIKLTLLPDNNSIRYWRHWKCQHATEGRKSFAPYLAGNYRRYAVQVSAAYPYKSLDTKYSFACFACCHEFCPSNVCFSADSVLPPPLVFFESSSKMKWHAPLQWFRLWLVEWWIVCRPDLTNLCGCQGVHCDVAKSPHCLCACPRPGAKCPTWNSRSRPRSLPRRFLTRGTHQKGSRHCSLPLHIIDVLNVLHWKQEWHLCCAYHRLKGKPKWGFALAWPWCRKCASVSTCMLCVVVLSLFMPLKYCLVSNLSSSQHSHVGLLFTNEEQKG